MGFLDNLVRGIESGDLKEAVTKTVDSLEAKLETAVDTVDKAAAKLDTSDRSADTSVEKRA